MRQAIRSTRRPTDLPRAMARALAALARIGRLAGTLLADRKGRGVRAQKQPGPAFRGRRILRSPIEEQGGAPPKSGRRQGGVQPAHGRAT